MLKWTAVSSIAMTAARPVFELGPLEPKSALGLQAVSIFFPCCWRHPSSHLKSGTCFWLMELLWMSNNGNKTNNNICRRPDSRRKKWWTSFFLFSRLSVSVSSLFFSISFLFSPPSDKKLFNSSSGNYFRLSLRSSFEAKIEVLTWLGKFLFGFGGGAQNGLVRLPS